MQFIYAKEAYERVLSENPEHSKVLQQLGWLYHQRDATFTNQELAVSYLEKSLASGMSVVTSFRKCSASMLIDQISFALDRSI